VEDRKQVCRRNLHASMLQTALQCLPVLVYYELKRCRGSSSFQEAALVGEDAAYFAVEQQSTGKWVFFTAELAIVLAIMYVVRHLDNFPLRVTPEYMAACRCKSNGMWKVRML
jgi:hypothetical protein